MEYIGDTTKELMLGIFTIYLILILLNFVLSFTKKIFKPTRKNGFSK